MPEGEVDATRAGEGMLSSGERRDAVEREARGAAPHGDVAILEQKARWPVAARGTTKEECRRQTQRYRHDWLTEVTLVAVLMQAESRPRRIAVDEAGVGGEPRETGHGFPVAGSSA